MFQRRWPSLVRESALGKSLGAGDLWSCGVVIYVMLSGDLPFADDPDMICSGEPPDFTDKVWQEVSEEAVNLICRLVEPDVEARWTAQQALEHEWFLRGRRSNSCSPCMNLDDRADDAHGEDLGDDEQGLQHSELARGLLRH